MAVMIPGRLLRSLQRRMATLVGRAVLLAVNAGTGLQSVQVRILADEVMDGVEHMEPYGFTSNPLPGAEGVVLNVAGQRGACVGVNFGNRGVRVAGLKSGEVCIYTDEGDKITLKRDRHVEIETLHLVIRAQEDVRVETKSYAVRATQGVTYETPSFGLGGGSGGCTANIAADMAITGNTTHYHRQRRCDGRRHLHRPSHPSRRFRRYYGGAAMRRVNDLALLPPAPLDVAGPDCGMEAGDLVAENTLRTAVILSLFLDRRANDDDILPNGSDDRRGWWADTVAPMTDYGIGGGSASGDRIGSRLWLLSREKQLAGVLERARHYAEEALAWLVEDGVATAVSVTASSPRSGWLALEVTITLPDTSEYRETFPLSV